MLHGKRITVVLPAYNAESTLKRTVDELDRSIRYHLEVSALGWGALAPTPAGISA